MFVVPEMVLAREKGLFTVKKDQKKTYDYEGKHLPPKNAGLRGSLAALPPPFFDPRALRAAQNHPTLCCSAEAQHPGGPRQVDPFQDRRVVIKS